MLQLKLSEEHVEMSEEHVAIVTPPSQNITTISSYLKISWFQFVNKILLLHQKKKEPFSPKMKKTAVV